MNLESALRAARSPACGLLDQAVYSGTNFLAIVFVARMLGPESFGVFAIVLAVWGAIWMLARAVFSEPFVIRASASTLSDWRAEAATAASALASAGVAVGIGIAVVALAVFTGELRTTLLALAVFVPILILQDFWRVAAFSRDRGQLALVNDVAWAVVQIAAFVVIWGAGMVSAPAALAAWALGGLAGCFVGYMQVRIRPNSPREALRWAREAARLGGWFGAAHGIHQIGAQSVYIVVGIFAGVAAVGGLRSVQALFGPLHTLQRGVELAVLPLLVRTGQHRTRSLVAVHSTVLGGIALLYGTVLVLGGAALLRAVYGGVFETYATLLIPVALSHVAAGTKTGPSMGLRALRAGRTLVLAHGLHALVLVASVGLATMAAGVTGAAWAGAAVGFAAAATFWFVLTWRTGQVRSSAVAAHGLGKEGSSAA